MQFLRRPLAYMLRLAREHGPVVGLARGGNRPLLVRTQERDATTFFVLGSQPASELLVDIDRFPSQAPPTPDTPANRRIGTNILFTNGDRHRHLRNLLRPAFERHRLVAYYDHMARLTGEMLDRWQGSSRVDIDSEMAELTLRIGSRCLFGIEVGGADRSLAHAMGEMLDLVYSPAALFPLNLPGTPHHRLRKLADEIDRGLRHEAQVKRDEGYTGDDFMSLMVKLHDENPEQLTDAELVGNAFTMFFAGHDTASKGLVWTLFLLAQHPEAAAELYEEIDRETGGAAPTFEQIYRLPVLDRVIKESLRVCSPATMFVRYAAEDASLGGYAVPKGSEIIYSPHVIHKDPRVFDQPRRFLPERWTECKPSRFEYLPFGAGPRICIGASFGGIQLRLVVAMAIHRMRWSIVPGTRIDLKTIGVIGPAKALPMTLRPQDRNFAASQGPVDGFIREIVDLDHVA